MVKWIKIADEPIPAGHQPVYITDGTHVSYVKRAEQPFTEVEKWIVAEAEAEHLKFPANVSNPTHWATSVPGLPKVNEDDRPIVSEGGPPPTQRGEPVFEAKHEGTEEASKTSGETVKVMKAKD